MCGRYLFDPLSGELDEYWQIISNVKNKLKEKDKRQSIASGEVFPSQNVFILGSNRNGGIVAGSAIWGFNNYGNRRLLINARSETVSEKSLSRTPFRNSRCVFIMNGFYEWDDSKDKYLFSNEEGLVYVGGFCRTNIQDGDNSVESIILTTIANDSVSPIHDRMPLIISPDDIREWLLNPEFARNYLTKNTNRLYAKKIRSL